MADAEPQPLRRELSGWLFWLAAFAIICAVLAATASPQPLRSSHSAQSNIAAPPPMMIPEAPPMELAPISPQNAEAQNAAIPLVTNGFISAKPFHYQGPADARARALDCMAAAMLYEAGDDARGQLAVGQVVINRARHPAFPSNICAVVFQGSERTTGCQFTFTCDGALARRYSDAAWARAKAAAEQVFTGKVTAEVGLATHYHTNWVRPYWSDTLDKIAIVDTHLFFRWAGYWGTPPAFRGNILGNDGAVRKLAALSAAHRGAAFTADAALPLDEDEASAAKESQIIAKRNASDTANRDTILVELDARAAPETFLTTALRLCGSRDYCKFFGWTNPTLRPASENMSDLQRMGMSFSYLRDDLAGFEKALWNCAEFKREDTRQCMKR